MSQAARISQIVGMLKERGAVSRSEFLERLNVSLATFKRDLDLIRDQLEIEVLWDEKKGGYYLQGDPARIQVAGPMYSAREINALLLMQDLLVQLQPGLLQRDLAPLRRRLQKLLGTSLPGDQIRRRIRILHMASRPVVDRSFQAASTATLARKRLKLSYHSRSTGQDTLREVSPQRLVYYRANWYLDSWCHLRQDLRSFALDSIVEAEVLDTPAREVEDAALDAHLGGGYGIFSGDATHTAVLRFEPEVVPWVEDEVWHAGQTKRMEDGGHLVLSVPYSQHIELTMDILRYGSKVEVLEPESLRLHVAQELRKAAGRYGSPGELPRTGE